MAPAPDPSLTAYGLFRVLFLVGRNQKVRDVLDRVGIP